MENNNLQKAYVYIGGMHCASCSARVEKRVSSLEGVAFAEVSLPLNRLKVEFDPLRLSLTDVAEAVEKLGYKVEKTAYKVEKTGEVSSKIISTNGASEHDAKETAKEAAEATKEDAEATKDAAEATQNTEESLEATPVRTLVRAPVRSVCAPARTLARAPARSVCTPVYTPVRTPTSAPVLIPTHTPVRTPVRLVFSIEGMHCASCSARVEAAIGKVLGVTKAEVNLPMETALVEGDLAQKDELEARIIASVKEKGYSAKLIKESAPKGSATVSLAPKGSVVKALSPRNLAEESLILGSLVLGSLPDGQLAPQNITNPGITNPAGGGPLEEGDDFLENVSIWTAQAEKDAKTLARMRQELWPAFIAACLLLFVNMGAMLLLNMGVTLPPFLVPEGSPVAFAVLQAILFLPCLWAGRSIYFDGVKRIRYLAPNMNTLVFLGSGSAAVYSFWNAMGVYLGNVHLVHNLYFEAAGVILALVLLGRYFEFKSRKKAGDAIFKLLNLAPEKAILLEAGVPYSGPYGSEDGSETSGETGGPYGSKDSGPYSGPYNGIQREIFVKDIKKGDLMLVLPGARIPVDGAVKKGDSWVDESFITGESLPVNKKVDSSVVGGSINGMGALVIKAERVGGATVLARIIKLVGEAQGSKAPIGSLADRISLYFVPVVLALAITAGLLWYFAGGESFAFALSTTIAVLVIACPCAMGLATPISIMVGTGLGAQKGVLVRGGGALQAAAEINTLIFDKTGTLTSSSIECTNIIVLNKLGEGSVVGEGRDAGESRAIGDTINGSLAQIINAEESALNSMEDVALRLAASVEVWSEHPLALAMVDYYKKKNLAKKKNLELLPVSNFSYLPGKGVKGDILLTRQKAGGLAGSRANEGNEDNGAKGDNGARGDNWDNWDSGDEILHAELLSLGYGLANAGASAGEDESIKRAVKVLEGRTALVLLINGHPFALFGFAAPVRPEAKFIIDEVKQMGITPIMLTGDRQSAAQKAALELGINEVYAEVLPEDKAEFVKSIMAQNKVPEGRVGMVGDGVNDAPALALAHVGIAMGTGTDVAMEAGDIVLMKEGLSGVLAALKLSRAVMRNIKQNLFWAFAYNIMCIPVAAGVLHIFGGPVLSPMLAGLAMALSSVTVVFNALRLKRLV